MDAQQILRQYFGYKNFRIGQEDLINGVLNGKDVLGIMPTSGGKSLCYQIPESALVLKGKEKVYKKVENKKVPLQNTLSLHEELFENLRKIRMELALEKNVPPYIIFADTTLKEMCAYLPKNKEEMLLIKGVGVNKFESYGKIFLDAITKYKEETGAEPIKNIAKENERFNNGKSNKVKTHDITYSLYKEGKLLEEIAKERQLTEDTVLRHFVKCHEEGKKINWDNIVDSDIEKQVLEVVEEVGRQFLKPIKEKLPDYISYVDIKKVLYKKKYENN